LALVAHRLDDAVAVDQSRAGADPRPGAGFAKVVDTGPEELPGEGGVVAEGEPCRDVRMGFGAEDFVVRAVFMCVEKLGFAIVDADHVHKIGEAAGEDVVLYRLEDGHGDGAGRIELMKKIAHRNELLPALRAGEIVVDFVSSGPDDDAGMVAVAADGVGDVGAPPITEVVAVILVLIFADGPDVEQFVHHQKPQAVADVEKFGRWGIVGCANSIDAEGFEYDQATFPDAVRDGNAERSAFAVDSGTEKLEVLPIEPEAGVGLELELADAEGDGLRIDGLAASENIDLRVVE
jgi:hypothetical protein